MITISLCMIVKSEAKIIGRCLDSVKDLVDEIVVADTGSTDGSQEIVRCYTSNVVDFAWTDDFASARQFVFSCASMDYILWLDADDLLLEPDRRKFAQLRQSLDLSVDAVSMPYHLGSDSDGNVTYSLRRHRLVRRDRNFKWYGAVHEYLAVSGNILISDIAITHRPIEHDSDRNLRIYERLLAGGHAFTPRDLFYFANECFDHEDYQRAIDYYEQFLNSKLGWIEDNLAACGKLADCYAYQGNTEKSSEYTLKSLEYDIPRAEVCCRLGYGFMQRDEWERARFWYELALTLKHQDDTQGFVNLACETWLPHLQLCVCYDRLGAFKLAYDHNELARVYRPHDAQVLHNKAYLESVLAQSYR